MTATADSKVYLRPIKDGVVRLGATDGAKTLWGATDTFNGHRDRDLQRLDFPGRPTPETLLNIFEQFEDGTFRQVLKSMSAPLGRLCFQQSQIKLFCESFQAKLRQQGVSTLLPFVHPREIVKESGWNVFVANVTLNKSVLGNKIDVFAHRFDFDFVWEGAGEYQWVLPQLEP